MTPLIVIRPQSGYINRLQAIVSAQLMAEELGGQLLIDWQPSPVTPVGLDSILSADFCDRYSSTSDEVSHRVGIDIHSIPAYLKFDSHHGVVTLAGLDRGEQFFMPSLRSILSTNNVAAIVISAGGKFTLSGGSRLTTGEQEVFRQRRHDAYRALSLQQNVEEEAGNLVSEHGDFLALHLRYSDRSLESPWRSRIAPALGGLRDDFEVTSLFIASDTGRERDRWMARAPSLGLHPWCVTEVSASRMDEAGAHSAMLDWRLLTKAKAGVYFASSSFAEEAAVAGGTYECSELLTSTPIRRMWMQILEYGAALRSYPERHGWR